MPPPTRPPPRAAVVSHADLAETKPLPRASAESVERLQSLLESVNRIRSASTAWRVAGECAAALTKTLGARGIIIHHYDERTRELRIIGVDGPNTGELLGSVGNADADFVATNVLASGGMMMVRVDGELPSHAPPRLRVLGASREVVAVPVMGKGGCVAIIELVDVDERCEPIVSDICKLLTEQLVRVLAAAT